VIGGEIKVEKINKSFGNFQVLKDINLQIKKGEFFSLLGPSGCGKTTLLRIIAGFEYPSDGILYLDGKDILGVPSNKRHVNTVFQNYALFPHLTVFENVAFPLRLKKYKESEIKKKVEEYLDLVRLNSHKKKYPSQLSGGQKQRVSIARALINEPSVLLLDEPLSALDAKLRQQLLIELDTIHDKVGITFVYVTHDQQEALSVSDRIAVMKDGVILQIGTPYEIYESPVNMFVADFIGESNLTTGKVVSVNEDKIVKINTEEHGELYTYLDKPVQVGDTLKVTIRPEKIRIATKKPENIPPNTNVLVGYVDELIYTGSETSYFVKIAQKNVFRVFKQHIVYFMDENPIKWKDEVYIWWYANDGFTVEVTK